MLAQFTKMHGLGNDFMILDLVTQKIRIDPNTVRRLADRHLGVGFDQLLLVEPPRKPHVDFYYRIFNADGTEAQQCGNGARCFARFVHNQGLSAKKKLLVECAAGIMTLHIRGHNEVCVEMGPPVFAPDKIPFHTPTQQLRYPLSLGEQVVKVCVLSLGNPHAVLQVEDAQSAPVSELGSKIEGHSAFPEGCNVGFMQVLSPSSIALRVWERAVGETLACGSGACAAAVSGMRLGLLTQKVRVQLTKGTLEIAWKGDDQPLFMTGSTCKVFEGQVRL